MRWFYNVNAFAKYYIIRNKRFAKRYIKYFGTNNPQRIGVASYKGLLAIDTTLLNLHIDETTCQGRSESSMTLSNYRSMLGNVRITLLNKKKKKENVGWLSLICTRRCISFIVYVDFDFYATFLLPLFFSFHFQGQRSVDERQMCIIYSTNQSNAEKRNNA